MIRQTSVAVYNQIKSDGTLSRMRLLTYDLLFKHGPCTAAELFAFAKREHGNTSLRDCFQKRLGELRDMGAAMELGTRPCNITGRNVIIWDVTSNLPTGLPKTKTKTQRAIEAEREACAQLAQKNNSIAGMAIAMQIRSRGQI
jgi:hypothetical protein